MLRFYFVLCMVVMLSACTRTKGSLTETQTTDTSLVTAPAPSDTMWLDTLSAGE